MQPAFWDRWLDNSYIGGFTNIGYWLRSGGFSPLPEDLSGRHIAVTGCNTGLGAEAVRILAERGAHLSMLCRNVAGAQAVADTCVSLHPAAVVEVVECDIASPTNIRAAVEKLQAGPELDVLINNAGVLNRVRAETAEGVEQSFAINLLGTFSLTMQLDTHLRSDGRIVTIASGGMYGAPINLKDPEFKEREYDGVKAYAEHKRAQVMLTEMWAKRWPERLVNVMHPGWAATPGVAKSLPGFNKVMKPLLRNAQQGMDTAIWLAVGEDVPASGHFWCDRKVRPTVRYERTRPRPGDAEALWALCVERTGVGGD